MHRALSITRTLFFAGIAVALAIMGRRLADEAQIRLIDDDAGHVMYTTVAQLQRVGVEDLVEMMLSREVLANEIEE